MHSIDAARRSGGAVEPSDTALPRQYCQRITHLIEVGVRCALTENYKIPTMIYLSKPIRGAANDESGYLGAQAPTYNNLPHTTLYPSDRLSVLSECTLLSVYVEWYIRRRLCSRWSMHVLILQCSRPAPYQATNRIRGVE
jgi:hypothetical protein